MPDEVLSQNEIDALLSALSSGEMDANELKKDEPEKKIRVYDFKRALRFSKDQIRGLTRIHENFARILTTYFSTRLRTFANISVATVDQIPYEEFIRSIPKQTILNVFSVSPLDGRILVEINPNIAYAMLDRVLGGRGTNYNKIENLTEIETKIMTQLFEKMIDNLKEAWSSLVEIDPTFEEFEVNPQFLQMVSPNETVVVISLNSVIGETSGMINICIPHITLEPIISKLSVHYWMENKSSKNSIEDTEKISYHLQGSSVELNAVLGESTITVDELLHLTNNDVIQLKQDINDPVTVFIHGEPKFYAQVGKRRNKLAIQLLNTFQEGES